MLSGFFKEYLDKSDLSVLLTQLIRQVYIALPHIPENQVKVANAGETHDMERGEPPFNWMFPELCSERLQHRANIMHDPLGGTALVIPHLANAHYTAYVFHREGVAFYNSLYSPPDTYLIANIHQALTKYYSVRSDLQTPRVNEALHNIANTQPTIQTCTKQTESWSCGYCTANVCLQTVLQQNVPSVNQPLEDIYQLQATFLCNKVTGNEQIWRTILPVLTRNPAQTVSINSPVPIINPQKANRTASTTNGLPLPKDKKIKQTQRRLPFRPLRPSFPMSSEPHPLKKNPIRNVTPPAHPPSMSHLPNTHPKGRAKRPKTEPHPPSQGTDKFPLTPDHPTWRPPTTPQQHPPMMSFTHSHNAIPSHPQPNYSPNPPHQASDLDSHFAKERTFSIGTPVPTTTHHQSIPTAPKLTRAQRKELTTAKRKASRRRNKNASKNQNPITNFLQSGGPQSLAVPRLKKDQKTKNTLPGNLYTAGAFHTLGPTQYRSPTRTLPRRYYDNDHQVQPESPPPPMAQDLPPTCTPPSPSVTTAQTLPTQEEPIYDILETHQLPTSPSWNCPTTIIQNTEPESPPLSICTLNVCKGGDEGLALADVEQLISSHSPDVLLLTETPYVTRSKPLTRLLSRSGYLFTYTPTPAPTPDQSFLPKEARLPKATLIKTTGGALCAYKKTAPWTPHSSPLLIPDKSLKSYITGIHIHHPNGNDRIIAATYIPHKHPQIKDRIWDQLASLKHCENDPLILIGGDFQEDVNRHGSTPRTLDLHPLPTPPGPTFNPAHAPQITTTIDGFLTASNKDPWALIRNINLSILDSAYADHNALILTIRSPNLPSIRPAKTSAQPRPPQLKIPFPKGKIGEWQDAVLRQHSDNILDTKIQAETLLHSFPDYDDPHWESQIMINTVSKLAKSLTQVLSHSLSLAHEYLPLSPTPVDLQEVERPPFIPKQLKATLDEAVMRSKLLRRFNHVGSHKNAKPYPYSLLASDLTHFPINPEFSMNLGLELPDNGSTPKKQEICEILQAHKKYAKRIRKAIKKAQLQRYSDSLEELYKQKPKKTMQRILNTAKETPHNQRLAMVKDSETGRLYTEHSDCIQAVQREQAINLTATVNPNDHHKYPWEAPDCRDPFKLAPTHTPPPNIMGTFTRAEYDLSLKLSSGNKATGPDNIPAEVIKHMPPAFHDSLFLIFALLARTKNTPEEWLQSNTVLIYKKGDPSVVDNYRPIALTNHLYKIWTSIITQILTDYVEHNHILSDTQEGFRKGKSTSRAVSHLQLLLEDAHIAHKNLYITYLDLKGAYPSVDHKQLQAILKDLGIPRDIIQIIAGLHRNANTVFLTPHGNTDPIPINRGTLQGDPLSPILFDLMLEPLSRWLQQGQHGYSPHSTGIPVEGLLYADDITLTTPSISSTSAQLEKVEQFGIWSHIRTSPTKCRVTAWVPTLQKLPKNLRDNALLDSLAHIKIQNTRIPALTQDEPLPGGYLGCQITASLSHGPQKQWLHDLLTDTEHAINLAPVSIHTKVSMIHYMVYSKIRHTMCLMPYDFEFLQRMDSLIASMTKKAWKLPRYMPTIATPCSKQDLGLDSPSLTMDYGATVASLLPEILSDEGRLGLIARASITQAVKNKENWPIELALDPGIGFLARAQSLLTTSGVKLNDVPKAWQSNPMCDNFRQFINDNLPDPTATPEEWEEPQLPKIRKIFRQTKPLWNNGLLALDQVLKPGPSPSSPPVILSFLEIQQLYPDIAKAPGVKTALEYLNDLLTADTLKEFSNNRSRSKNALQPPRSMANRWLTGASPLPSPTSAPEPIPSRYNAPNKITQKPTPTPTQPTPHSNPGQRRTRKRQKKDYVCDQPVNSGDPSGYYAKVIAITDERTVKADTIGIEGDSNTLIKQYLVQWEVETLPYKDLQTQEKAGLEAEWIRPLPEVEEPVVANTPCQVCKLPDTITNNANPQFLCEACHKWTHAQCLPADEPDPTPKPVWFCPQCRQKGRHKRPAPYQLMQVQWSPSWTGYRHLIGKHGIPGAAEAMQAYRERRANKTTLPTQAHTHDNSTKNPPALYNRIRSKTYPPRLRHFPNTTISTTPIDPDRDASPGNNQGRYSSFLVHPQHSQTPKIRVCDPEGKAVSPKDLSIERYNFLAAQHAIHSPDTDLHKDLASLLLRYHPKKSKVVNPQGRRLDLRNHWAIPLELASHLRSWTPGPTTELFASPLNCYPDPSHTYYSAHQEDKVFGARFNSMNTSWRGHCIGNPEYEHEDMMNAMQRAIDSAEASPQPFTCILILPRWKDTPYRQQGILTHPRVKIITGIEAHHMKFVPADSDITSPEEHSTGSAAWAVDLILVSNPQGYNTIPWNLVQKELPTTLRQCAQSPDMHVNFFPHPGNLRCLPPPRDRTSTARVLGSPPPPPVKAAASPTPAPLDPPPQDYSPSWPAQPVLPQLQKFNITKDTPLTVIELCGGIGTGLEAVLKAGYSVGSYTWADINPDGHTVLSHTIPKLQQEYGSRFPASATEGWDTRLPFDINLITPELLNEAFPNGAHLAIAGPPCQPYSVAGKKRGMQDRRGSALLSVARTIHHLATSHSRGVGFIVENVPGVKNFPEVLETLGPPVLTDAPPCGSVAKRETLFWTNLTDITNLQQKFDMIQTKPPPSLARFLRDNGFHDWTIPTLVGHNRAPPADKYNRIGRQLTVLPKFVCHPNQRAYRKKGGYGRLRHKGVLSVPSVHMKERAMGFQKDRTEGGGLKDAHRHYLLGQCIDLNLLTWLMSACEGQGQGTVRNPAHQASHPLQSKASLEVDASLQRPPPSIQQHHLDLPQWTQAHDPTRYTYTDGSKKDGARVLGAAVFHAPSQTTHYIDATGKDECNTVVRAELAAILHALETYREEHTLHVLTDSLTSIQKIMMLHSRPVRCSKDHHHPLLQKIAALLTHRGETGKVTSIQKVTAHLGIWGNEVADKAAQAVVDALTKQANAQGDAPTPHWIQITSAPRNPHRRRHYLTLDPPPSPEIEEDPPPRVLVTKQSINAEIKPSLRCLTARPSLYHALMQKARQADDPTDFTNTAKYIGALTRAGDRRQAKRLLSFLWGVMYTQKQAFRFHHSPDQVCPVCRQETDSCTHVGSGCKHKHMKALYLDRHNAAVRIIRRFVTHSPVGASNLAAGTILVSEDSGIKPLPEDLLPSDDIIAHQETFLQTVFPANSPYPPTPTPSPTLRDHIKEDLTIELKAYEQACIYQDTGDKIETVMHPPVAPQRTIPDWILPKDAQQRLLIAMNGFMPDLVFVQGAPSPNPAQVTALNKQQWKITLIEVGFCADLRLSHKKQSKEEKYLPLLQELRLEWSNVHLLVVPIGNAGAMLHSTKSALATLISTHPQKRLEAARAEQLARTLATMAAKRLYGVTAEYYRLRRQTAATSSEAAQRIEPNSKRLKDNEPSQRNTQRVEPVHTPSPSIRNAGQHQRSPPDHLPTHRRATYKRDRKASLSNTRLRTARPGQSVDRHKISRSPGTGHRGTLPSTRPPQDYHNI